MYGSARKQFEDKGVRIARSLVGNYVTSLDMAVCSITLTAALEMLELWEALVDTAALHC